MYDWSKEITTCDPEYFQTTQLIFTKLYEKGLAKLAPIDVNWCEELQTVLANEEIVYEDHKMYSERGHYLVVKRPMYQWVLKITQYAEQLLAGLDDLDWPNPIKELQSNWIGKHTCHEVVFQVANSDLKIPVFLDDLASIYQSIGALLPPESIYLKHFIQYINQETQAKITELKNLPDFMRSNIESNHQIIRLDNVQLVCPLTSKKLPVFITNHIESYQGINVRLLLDAKHKINEKIADLAHINLNHLNYYDKEQDVYINSGLINGYSKGEQADNILIKTLKSSCTEN